MKCHCVFSDIPKKLTKKKVAEKISINRYLYSSLIALFLCAFKVNADEVEMGCCRFEAPDTEFAEGFNKQSLAEDNDPDACDKNNVCFFNWVLHPNKYLITNIGDDKNKVKVSTDPFNNTRSLGAYIVNIPAKGAYAVGKNSKVVDGFISLNGTEKLTKMECKVSLVKTQANTGVVKANQNISDDYFLAKLTETCQWR